MTWMWKTDIISLYLVATGNNYRYTAVIQTKMETRSNEETRFYYQFCFFFSLDTDTGKAVRNSYLVCLCIDNQKCHARININWWLSILNGKQFISRFLIYNNNLRCLITFVIRSYSKYLSLVHSCEIRNHDDGYYSRVHVLYHCILL